MFSLSVDAVEETGAIVVTVSSLEENGKLVSGDGGRLGPGSASTQIIGTANSMVFVNFSSNNALWKINDLV